ncbi:MAG: hypothetical protein L3J54_14430 [Draconibacterium sp.]|nr:hypothetical protein [Draconibacterium sp.]
MSCWIIDRWLKPTVKDSILNNSYCCQLYALSPSGRYVTFNHDYSKFYRMHPPVTG